MKLIYSPGACSLATHIILREAGLKFELEKVNFANLEKVNPKGYVPTLVLENGDVLTEGTMLAQYLADKVPDKKLIPKAGTMERYRTMEWLNYIATELHKGFNPLFIDEMPTEAKNLFKKYLTGKMELLEKHFSKNQYLMGHDYTVADAYLFTILSWAEGVELDLSKFKSVTAFIERIKTRPATQQAMKAEGLI